MTRSKSRKNVYLGSRCQSIRVHSGRDVVAASDRRAGRNRTQRTHISTVQRRQRVTSQPSLSDTHTLLQSGHSPNSTAALDQVFKYLSLWGTNFPLTTALHPLKDILVILRLGADVSSFCKDIKFLFLFFWDKCPGLETVGSPANELLNL